MLLPIGHEEASVRRLPWVSIAIVVVCIVVFFSTGHGGTQAQELAQESFQELIQFYVKHPYLPLPEELAETFSHEEETMIAAFESMAGRPPKAVTEQAQAELDRLVQKWRDAMAALEEGAVETMGLVPAKLELGDLIAHLFIHFGWMHLLGNMFFLWLSGPPLEDVWGRPFYAAFYLTVGIAGSLMWVVTYPDSTQPLVGASGAVAGLMGAFMVRYWSTKIKVLYWVGFRVGVINAPAWLMLGLWFMRELVWATGVGDRLGVAFWVHVWGFVFGAGTAGLLRHFKVEERVFQPKIGVKLGDEANPVIEQAQELRQQGRLEEAWDLLSAAARERPNNFEANLGLWDVGVQLGRQPQAAAAFLRCIRQELRQGEHDLGLYHWLELQENVPDVETDLDLRIRLAEAMLEQQRDEEAAELLAHEQLDPAVPMGIKVRLARVAARAASASAPAICEPLLASPDLPDPIRQELTELYGRAKAFLRSPRAPAPPPPGSGVVAAGAAALGIAASATPPPPGAPPAGVAPAGSPTAGATTSYLQSAPPPGAGTAPPPPPPGVPAAAGTPASPPEDDNAPIPLIEETQGNRSLKVIPAVPRTLTGDKITVEVARQGNRTLPLNRIQAVAVAKIDEGFAAAYVLIDLLVDSLWGNRPEVRTVRLRSTDFDARTLIPSEGDPQQALAVLIDNLLAISDAYPMPDPDAVRGRPFHSFVSVPEYEAKVIGFTSR